MRQAVWIINLSKDTAYDNPHLLELLATQGDFWTCTSLDVAVANKKDGSDLMQKLLEEGARCRESFRQKGYPVNVFRVCVIGDSADEKAMSCFSIIATLIRKVFPLRNNQTGIDISGLLYIPCEIRKERLSDFAQFIDELQLASRNDCEAYNRIVICQEVQNQDPPAYGQLDSKELSELLFQYLLSIYYLEHDEVPIFGRIVNNPSYFYTMGATSVYYDAPAHKKELIDYLSENLFKTLTAEENCSTDDAKKHVDLFMKEQAVDAATLVSIVKGTLPDFIDRQKLDKLVGDPNPHPVKDFVKASLIHSYYLDYLKFLPARLRKYFQEHVNMLVTSVSFLFSKNRAEKQKGMQNLIVNDIKQLIINGPVRYATYSQIICYYRQFEEAFKRIRDNVTCMSPGEDLFPVPKYLQHYYSESKAANSRDHVNQIITKLKETLQTEPTFLALLTRSFFLGVILALVLTPLLSNMASVYVLIPLLFFIPFIWNFAIRLRRHFLIVRKQKNRIVAEAIWQSQQLLQKRLVSEVIRYLNGLQAFCREQMKKTEKEREQASYVKMKQARLSIPQTKFNQPLISGSFNGETITQYNPILETRVKILGANKLASRVEREDYLRLLSALVKNETDLQNSLLNPQGAPDDNDANNTTSSRLSTVFNRNCEKDIVGSLENTICEFINSRSEKADFTFKNFVAMAGVSGKFHDSFLTRDAFVRSQGEATELSACIHANYNDTQATCATHVFFTKLSRGFNLSARAVIGDFAPSSKIRSFAYYLLVGAIRQSGSDYDEQALDEENIKNASELLK